MFEVVKVIVDTLFKVLDPKGISTLVRDKKKRELGSELFVFYLRLNEIITTGDSIVSSLEIYCERMKHHLAHGTDAYALSGGEWIEASLARQRINIAKFGRSAQRLHKELQIIDAECFRALKPLMIGKRNALDSLLRHLGRGELPALGPTALSLEKLTSPIGADVPNQAYVDFKRRCEVQTEFEKGALTARKSWDESAYKVVKKYLSEREPRKKLDEIANLARGLKESLTKHFSISDVLLDVRDRRFDLRGSGDHFW